jgi:hypothetical protein
METKMTKQQLTELIASRVDFTPVKAYRKTWTNNHKHIVEKRALGEDVDNPVSVYWTAEWTICGLSDNAFLESLGGNQGGEFIKWQVDSKTKKGVAEQFHEVIVLELADCLYYFFDLWSEENEKVADAILKALTEGAKELD